MRRASAKAAELRRSGDGAAAERRRRGGGAGGSGGVPAPRRVAAPRPKRPREGDAVETPLEVPGDLVPADLPEGFSDGVLLRDGAEVQQGAPDRARDPLVPFLVERAAEHAGGLGTADLRHRANRRFADGGGVVPQ